MPTIMAGCQGKPELTITEKPCPNCGFPIEIASIDTSATCEQCGFTIYNDQLTCVQWCDKARECFGDKAYEQLKAVADMQKQRMEEERAAKKAAREAAAKNQA